MTDRKTMDLAERRTAERSIAEDRKEARRDYVRYSEEAAKEDLAYRKAKATRYVELRAEGETAEGSKIRAEAEAGEHKYRCKIAESMAKSALLRIEEAERASVVVRDLHSSSQKVDGLAP
jgi:hypothetical protein